MNETPHNLIFRRFGEGRSCKISLGTVPVLDAYLSSHACDNFDMLSDIFVTNVALSVRAFILKRMYNIR